MKEEKKKCAGCQKCKSHCRSKVIEEFEETAVDPERIANWLGWKLTGKKKDEIMDEYSKIVSRKTHPRIALTFRYEKSSDKYFLSVFVSANKKYLSTMLGFANIERVKYCKLEASGNGKTWEFKIVQILKSHGGISFSDDNPRQINVWSN